MFSYNELFNYNWYSLIKQNSLRQFPDIERSEITIDTVYPGAASNIVETKITEIIEAQISGIDGIESISSVSRDEGQKYQNLLRKKILMKLLMMLETQYQEF